MLESKRKAIIFFIIALMLALLTGFLVLKKVQALNSDLGTMVDVYVANKEISSRALLTPDDITKEEIPKKYVRDEHITDANDLKNKVSAVPLSSGDVITSNVLKQSSSVIEEGNRLLTLMKSERVLFDEKLSALDRVDIVVSHQIDKEQKTEVFMKDVKVARVAKREGEFSGVQLEIPFERVPEFIHMQNYADSFRVIKANVGQLEKPEQQENESQEKHDPPEDKKQANKKQEEGKKGE